ncbi:hypothetical protein EV426DRAFT_571940 [Tirmania nivea]|nr:hypothetical protein EV426DRAFT_571940 [Tirmania nivea]
MDPGGRTGVSRQGNLLCLSAGAYTLFGKGLCVPGNQPWPVVVRGTWIPPDAENEVPIGQEDLDGDARGDNEGRGVIAPGRWILTQVLDPGNQMAEEADEDLDGVQLARMTRELRPVCKCTGPRKSGMNPVGTGLIFTLTTHDPEKYPLPHPDLLLLHAAVMRVARAAGAAPLDEDYDWGTEEGETRNHIPAADVHFRVREYLENLVESDHMEPPDDPGL